MFTEYRENKYMLTKREDEICKLLCKGYSDKKIATELYITNNTVKKHIRNIMYKSKFKNRTQIAIEYIKITNKNISKSYKNIYRLTKREMEICKLLCKGYSNREIALELHIDILTVKSFIRNITDKSGFKNRTQIAIEYFKIMKGKI